MKFLFTFRNKKAEAKKEPRRFEVPFDKLEEFWRLYDIPGKSGKFRVWNYIATMFPEAKSGGDWRIEQSSIFEVAIIENMGDD